MRRAPLFIAVLSVAACLSDDAPQLPPMAGAPSATANAPKTAGSEAQVAPPPIDIDVDSGEFDKMRDPFAPQASNDGPIGCSPTEQARKERASTVPFGDVGVASLVVRGTLSAGHQGSAILTDPQGHTQVVAVGMKVGSQTADKQGSCREWRVDRVREGEVVLLESGGPDSAAPKTFVLHTARS